MIKKILDALKTKFAGVDEAFLTKKAEKLAKTITKEEEISTAVDGVTFQSLLDSYKDTFVTDAVKTAIGNYETKYGIKDGKPVEPTTPPAPTTPPTTPPAGTTPELTALLQSQAKQIETLTAAVTAMQTKSVTDKRTAAVAEMLKNAPAALRTQYTSDFDRMAGSFKDDADFDAWIKTTSESVKTLTDAMNAKGGIFNPPAGSGGNPPANIDAYVKQRVEERAAAYNNGGSVIRGLQPKATAPVQGMPTAGNGNNQ